jgi:hypothetical protein
MTSHQELVFLKNRKMLNRYEVKMIFTNEEFQVLTNPMRKQYNAVSDRLNVSFGCKDRSMEHRMTDVVLDLGLS